MSYNLKTIKQDIDSRITDAGGALSITAAEHNDVLSRTLYAAGRTSGFEYTMLGTGTPASGQLSANGNDLGLSTSQITITLGEKNILGSVTQDLLGTAQATNRVQLRLDDGSEFVYELMSISFDGVGRATLTLQGVQGNTSGYTVVDSDRVTITVSSLSTSGTIDLTQTITQVGHGITLSNGIAAVHETEDGSGDVVQTNSLDASDDVDYWVIGTPTVDTYIRVRSGSQVIAGLSAFLGNNLDVFLQDDGTIGTTPGEAYIYIGHMIANDTIDLEYPNKINGSSSASNLQDVTDAGNTTSTSINLLDNTTIQLGTLTPTRNQLGVVNGIVGGHYVLDANNYADSGPITGNTTITQTLRSDSFGVDDLVDVSMQQTRAGLNFLHNNLATTDTFGFTQTLAGFTLNAIDLTLSEYAVRDDGPMPMSGARSMYMLDADGVVRVGESGLGWASYADTAYTSGSPFSLTAGSTTTIPNNAGTVVNTYAPSDATGWWSSNKFNPVDEGDVFMWQVQFLVQPSLNNRNSRIDLSDGVNVLGLKSVRMLEGAGSVTRFSETFIVPITAEAVLNGIEFQFTINGVASMYNIKHIITRIYKA